jgi:hypothetical protein
MSTSSDSADEFVKMMLDGTEVVARLTGNMAKEIAVILYAMSKERNEHKKGKVRLNKMLKSKSNLKIFSIKKENLEDFKKGANKYGVQYSTIYVKKKANKDNVDDSIKDKVNKDGIDDSIKDEINKEGIIDIVVKEEDAVFINRIVEQYNLTTVDQSKLDEVLQKAEVENPNPTDKERIEVQKEVQEKNTSQDLLNKLMKKQNIKEENENTNPSNIPSTEKDTPSENLLKTNEKTEEIENEEKPSIREKLENIKKENEEKQKENETPKQEKTKEIKHKQPKKKNRKRERSK